MLTLERLAGEAVILESEGLRIRVLVQHLGEGKVKLGFDAPKSVKILREELVLNGATKLRIDGRPVSIVAERLSFDALVDLARVPVGKRIRKIAYKDTVSGKDGIINPEDMIELVPGMIFNTIAFDR